jgi:hypothetical protein
MGKLRYTLTILTFVIFCTYAGSWAQEIVVLPGGVLEQDDRAEVKGDYVRVRTGPSLEHRILTKVNHGTPVTIISRDENLVSIGEMKNYWYRIRLDKSGIEGWMFGHFLGKRESPLMQEEKGVQKTTTLDEPISFEKNASLGPELPLFDDGGTIAQPESLTTSGDLNGNGIEEIIFLSGGERGRSYTLTGYEPSQEGTEKHSFRETYRLDVRASGVHSFKVFSGEWLDFPLLVVNAAPFSQIYRVDEQRNILRFMYKTDSPLLSVGSLNGVDRHLIYLKRNRVQDNDGTITYFIHAASFDTSRGRFTTADRISYPQPLPVKKLVTSDLDSDGKSEIVCEIGGGNNGGGIVVLHLGEKGLERIVNTGFITYKDEQFHGMWGGNVNHEKRLVLYTTDPYGGKDATSSFGFLTASLNERGLNAERFYPVNKLLDDVNNYRVPLLMDNGEEELPFMLMDFNDERTQYQVWRPLYQ